MSVSSVFAVRESLSPQEASCGGVERELLTTQEGGTCLWVARLIASKLFN